MNKISNISSFRPPVILHLNLLPSLHLNDQPTTTQDSRETPSSDFMFFSTTPSPQATLLVITLKPERSRQGKAKTRESESKWKPHPRSMTMSVAPLGHFPFPRSTLEVGGKTPYSPALGGECEWHSSSRSSDSSVARLARLQRRCRLFFYIWGDGVDLSRGDNIPSIKCLM